MEKATFYIEHIGKKHSSFIITSLDKDKRD